MSSIMSKTRLWCATSAAALSLVPALAAAQTMVPYAPVVQPIGPGAAPRPTSGIALTIDQWQLLRSTNNLPFSSYASFLVANPGWPGEAGLRKNAETMLRADAESPALVASFFARFPPQNATSWLRLAEAQASLGRADAAREAARNAWIGGALSADDETRLLGRFASAIGPAEHDARMDRLLWNRSTSAAQRQLALTSPARRITFDTRLALLTKASDASAKALAVGEAALADPGFANDYAWWLRATNQPGLVRQIFASRRTYTSPPLSPESWLSSRLAAAKGAHSAGESRVAYDIARQADDAYPAGTAVRERSFAERDLYTDLVWLGATTAMNRLGRPADAQFLFERYAAAAQSLQTQSRGLYWAARAAQAAGKTYEANALYERAGAMFDQFYGQLALERLGRKPMLPMAVMRTVEISAADRANFDGRTVVQALAFLGQSGRWIDQSLFVRALANGLRTDHEHVLAAELANRVNRTDLKLLVGKNARSLGLPDYFASAFPQLPVPSEHASSWTIIHAIARQESQFDRQATSPVGARGLMQLMPGTARETAPRAGVTYEYGRLAEPIYNMQLGSTYFGQLMDRFGGNYVLSVAAYNAGPGRVNQWLRANGDPRAGVDVLTWIEAIPIEETRNYVQRVLENAVVYDLVNPRRSASRSPTTLSALLGKPGTTGGL